MYENNNSVSIDWKGLFLKVIIVAIIVFALFKGYEYFSNKQNKKNTTTSTATQLFNANLESLRQAGENYYDNTNFPSEGQTVMATLGELATKGDIKELYDENGNACSRENSYVSLTNDNGQYKLKATLTCGGTSNYTVVMIGCECEQDNVCAIKREEEIENTTNATSSKGTNYSNSNSKKSTNSTSSKGSTSNNNTNTKSNSSSKSSGKQVNVYNNYNNNVNSYNTNSNNNNSGSNNASGSNGSNSGTKKTTTTTRRTTTNNNNNNNGYNNNTQYRVTFDSNGGTSVSTQYVYRYGTAYKPSNPRKSNATFVGWYYNGRLFDFNTPITSDIRLEAYYWETKTLTTQVYSAAYDTYGSTYVTVSHKLAIPRQLQNSNVKDVKISYIKSARTMSSTSDLQNYVNLHSSTFDGYNYGATQNNYTVNANFLGRLNSITVRKENSYIYDRWIRWSANVYNQCRQPFTFDGMTNQCDYGIVYTVVWEYTTLSN